MPFQYALDMLWCMHKTGDDAGGPNLDPDLANNIVQLAIASGQESAFRQVLEEYRQVGTEPYCAAGFPFAWLQHC